MKHKKHTSVLIITLACMLLTSCATILGGRRTPYQLTKPNRGEHQREVRVVALLGDIILFPPGIIIDFATKAIYRPWPRHSSFKSDWRKE